MKVNAARKARCPMRGLHRERLAGERFADRLEAGKRLADALIARGFG